MIWMARQDFAIVKLYVFAFYFFPDFTQKGLGDQRRLTEERKMI